MEARAEKKGQKRKRKKKGQQQKKVDCGTTLVNWESGVGWEKDAHPTDRTANWFSHEGWFTLAVTEAQIDGPRI